MRLPLTFWLFLGKRCFCYVQAGERPVWDVAGAGRACRKQMHKPPKSPSCQKQVKTLRLPHKSHERTSLGQLRKKIGLGSFVLELGLFRHPEPCLARLRRGLSARCRQRTARMTSEPARHWQHENKSQWAFQEIEAPILKFILKFKGFRMV